MLIVDLLNWMSAEPSQPQNLKADATSNAELEISWEPPKYPNGIVSQYTVRGRLREEDMKYYDSQNSCAGNLRPNSPIFFLIFFFT